MAQHLIVEWLNSLNKYRHLRLEKIVGDIIGDVDEMVNGSATNFFSRAAISSLDW
ncbi:MAG: hypothetical protein ACI8VC_001108 [Candidatus Endobugula sp.]|jgi:hypothetical protein